MRSEESVADDKQRWEHVAAANAECEREPVNVTAVTII